MTKYCTECGEELKDSSKFCENCGVKTFNDAPITNEIEEDIYEIEKKEDKKIDERYNIEKAKIDSEITYEKSIGISVVLALVFPPLGQFYNGQILKGIIFLFINLLLGLISWALSLIFWIYMIYDAYKTTKEINQNNGNYFFNENIKKQGVR